MPAVQTLVKNFFKKEPCKGVNPDEAVAMGAAIQGGIMTKKYSGGSQMILLDVTPLTLGIETMGGVFTPIIDRNSTIPIKKSKVFSTAQDQQTEVEVKVLQGERPIADENKLLGKFTMDGLPPVAKGVPQIEVSFDVDASGVVHVSATDKKTGKAQSIKVQAKGGLSESEIDELIKQAELHKEEDNKRRESVEIKNSCETKINTFENSLNEYKSSMPQTDQDALTTQITAVRALMTTEGADLQALKDELAKLETSAMGIFERAYNSKSAGGDAENKENKEKK